MEKSSLALISLLFCCTLFTSCNGVDDDYTPEPAKLSDLTFEKDWGQQSFAASITPGNYSGITKISGNQYAVVDDKSATDGFRVLTLGIDESKSRISSATISNLISNGQTNRDSEGIIYIPSTDKLLISAEGDNKVLEYSIDGTLTGRSLAIPTKFSEASVSAGLEALAYNSTTHLIWTTTESTIPTDGEMSSSTNGICNKLRLQSFDEELNVQKQYAYLMDAPTAKKASSLYAMGVSDMTALDDGRIIVLEREFFVPTGILESFVNCKLYVVNPPTGTAISSNDVLDSSSPYLSKKLLYEFKTNITNIANFEGMCLGPTLTNGNKTLILISDSQNNYGKFLRDWIKIIEFK